MLEFLEEKEVIFDKLDISKMMNDTESDLRDRCMKASGHTVIPQVFHEEQLRDGRFITTHIGDVNFMKNLCDDEYTDIGTGFILPTFGEIFSEIAFSLRREKADRKDMEEERLEKTSKHVRNIDLMTSQNRAEVNRITRQIEDLEKLIAVKKNSKRNLKRSERTLDLKQIRVKLQLEGINESYSLQRQDLYNKLAEAKDRRSLLLNDDVLKQKIIFKAFEDTCTFSSFYMMLLI